MVIFLELISYSAFGTLEWCGMKSFTIRNPFSFGMEWNPLSVLVLEGKVEWNNNSIFLFEKIIIVNCNVYIVLPKNILLAYIKCIFHPLTHIKTPKEY